jgi:dihydrofolate reductase
MGRVIVEMTVSLDGYAAGEDVDVDHPLGRNGERFHRWHQSTEAIDTEAAAGFMVGTGAFILGRTMFDVGIDKWGDDGTFGMPCFVLTSRPHEVVRRGPTMFTFVTEGLRAALKQAQIVAEDRAVVIMGGPNVAQQALRAGLVDELRLHIEPFLLGAGTRLFDGLPAANIELSTTRVASTRYATHMTLNLTTPRPK